MTSKSCEQCGAVFEKPRTCGRPEWEKRRFCSAACKANSQRGIPTWNKGLTSPSNAQMVPCRICGQPTRYAGATKSPLLGKVHCGAPACAEQSKRIKNEAIRERAERDYASGQRKKIRHAWKHVQRVSPEELALTPWMESNGWVPQLHFNTGVHTNTLPRQFILDFALPAHKLYVEIDGSVHRLRKERDARRDKMMAEHGWEGLRIPVAAVRDDIESAKTAIEHWSGLILARRDIATRFQLNII